MLELRPVFLAILLAFATNAYAQQEPPYVQVLVPFDTLLVNGGGGELWSAELLVRNSADVAVNLFPETCFVFGRPFPCERRIAVPPGETHALDVLESDSLQNPGLLLYVPITHREYVDFTLTVRNLASDDRIGTSIPIVERSQLLPHARIVGVPLDSEHRPTLRVYDPFLPPNAVFRVRVIDEATNAVIFDREYSRFLPTDPPSPALVPATFDFSDALEAAMASGSQRVTVTVERIWPRQLGFWPMISITSNRDGRIAVFTPHPF